MHFAGLLFIVVAALVGVHAEEAHTAHSEKQSYHIYTENGNEIHEEYTDADSGPAVSSAAARDKMMLNFRRMFGKDCELDVFPGTCVITSVTPDKTGQFAKVLLSFRDAVSQAVEEGLTYMLFIAEPSLQYVEANGIAEGAEFSCKKKVSRSGPCEPVQVTLDSVDDHTLVDEPLESGDEKIEL